MFSILIKYNKLILISLIAFLFQSLSSNAYAAPPLLPMVFSGTITVNSGESPDGRLLVGRIFDSKGTILYTSNNVKVSGNKYVALTLGPFDAVAIGKQIKFYFICAEIPCSDAATETINFASAQVKFRYSLTFAKVPPTDLEFAASAKAKADMEAAAKAQSNTDAANTVAKAKAEADASAKAKADADEAKAQSKTDAAASTKAAVKVEPEPQAAFPSVYSGSIVVAGTEIPGNAVLRAKIGDYTSPPAIISGNSFQNLVISPGNSTYINKPIIFLLNNVESEPIQELYIPGSTKDIRLIFIGLPLEPKANEESKDLISSPSPDTSSGSNCSFVSSNNNKNYSGAISLALMLLVPLIAFKSKKIK